MDFGSTFCKRTNVDQFNDSKSIAFKPVFSTYRAESKIKENWSDTLRYYNMFQILSFDFLGIVEDHTQ